MDEDEGSIDNEGSKERKNFWNKCEEEPLTARPRIGSWKRKDEVQSQNEEAMGSAQKQTDEKKKSTEENPSENAHQTKK
uniref:Uncharacterized protein n=1 Tax=Glossina pallidipes TaxID=7398 RepID=A0A1A9ZIJ9_GLOPL